MLFVVPYFVVVSALECDIKEEKSHRCSDGTEALADNLDRVQLDVLTDEVGHLLLLPTSHDNNGE